MIIKIGHVARALEMSEEQVLQEALRALLRAKIHAYDAERRACCAKFGAASLQELDELVKRGAVDEDAVLNDFQNVDYLTHRIERFQQLLGET